MSKLNEIPFEIKGLDDISHDEYGPPDPFFSVQYTQNGRCLAKMVDNPVEFIRLCYKHNWTITHISLFI